MRHRAALCVVGALAFAVSLGAAQRTSAEKTIRLSFPDGVDLTGMSIDYFLSGPFGGYGAPARIDPSRREQSIDIWHNGQPGTSIKVIVYCPGYGFRLFAESDLMSRPIGTLTIELEPLRTVVLGGRINGLPATAGLFIEAGYFKDWECRFFELVDCAQAPDTVARSTIADDGTFTLDVPDFLTDPVVRWYQQPGRLALRVRGTTNLELEDAQNRGQRVSLPIASSYPGNLQLMAVPR